MLRIALVNHEVPIAILGLILREATKTPLLEDERMEQLVMR